MVKTQNIIFDSFYRTSGSNNKPTFTLPNVGIQAKGFYVNSVSIPHSFYNITQYNNILRWSNSTSTSTTSTIPIGNYSITELLTEIGTQMTATTNDGLIYTASRNTKTNKVTITNNGPSSFGLRIVSSLEQENLSFIFVLLGFSGADVDTYKQTLNLQYLQQLYTGTSITALNSYFISTNNIYIKSNICNKSTSYNSDASFFKYDTAQDNYKWFRGLTDILLYIPITTNYGDRIIWNTGNNPTKISTESHITSITFELTDDNNFKQLDLNGRSWTIELVFEC